VSLALLLGPANAGKVATLLDRYVAALDRGPLLVVPNRAEVERVELDILTRTGAILGGWIGTFDDLFARLDHSGGPSAIVTPVQREIVLSRVVSGTELESLASSARFAGFAEALGDALAELASASVGPDEVDGELGVLYRAYVEELDRVGHTDRHLRAASAARRLGEQLDAWDGAPVFIYGFEDLTGAQWTLVESLAGRTEVVVSLPYEPGRAVFAALERTANDLAALARGDISELRPQGWYDAPALAHLERALFDGAVELPPKATPPPIDGVIRFLEAAGTRAALELVGEEILALLRSGTPADDIGVVVPSVQRARAPLETAFGSLGVPYAIEGSYRLGRTPFGHALLELLRFAWLGGRRSELFGFLRSPYSGLSRPRADFVEGRLRGRGVAAPGRVEEEAVRHLGAPIPALDLVREGAPAAAVCSLARSMLESAWGLEAPPVGVAELDLRAEEAIRRVLDEIEELGVPVEPEAIVAALERAPVLLRPRGAGRVTVLDLLRARTRRFGAVFVLGLEEGVLPRRAADEPFLTEELRAGLEAGQGRRRRLRGADDLARDRYLFYTACTRAWRRLYLVREAATDEGRPLEPSPFYDEVRRLFAPDAVERMTRRRPLSALAWELHRAPTERERLRSVAALAASDAGAARRVAAAGGWTRQIERALEAFARPTRLANPHVLRRLRDVDRFSVTELEVFGDCSSMWLVERLLDPRPIDGEIDARLRGQVAHQALYRFYSGIPRRMGTDRVDPERIDDAIEFLHECLDEAITGQVRLEASELDLLELRSSLARDLEHFVRQDVALGFPLVPSRLEVSFGSERAAPELQRGIDLGGFVVSGKIDRIDVDPFSARGIVQDYKSGVAHSARRIEQDRRLQVPLYVLALRDLVGMEPLGGLYRSLSGEREARGMVRSDSAADVPGIATQDYLDEETFWGTVDGAVDRARTAVGRLQSGDIRHDPRWSDGCPTWCRSFAMCRVERA
jgi:ATP-dependent helicase/nuclease subunit B